MIKTRLTHLWLAALILVALLMITLASAMTTSAQGDLNPMTVTPLPSPTNNGGSAKWTVDSMTFQSNYPKGFDFNVTAKSDGGKIVQATVYWLHAPGFIRHANGKIDDSGNITASWKPGISDAVPQWVGVEYWWQLKDEAGNIFQTNHKNDDYADDTRKWGHDESDDVVVYWQEGVPNDVGKAVIDAVRNNREIYNRNWGTLLNYKPHVIIYADYQPFEEWNPGVSTAAGATRVQTVGTTSDTWGGTAQLFIPSAGAEGLAKGTVLHEIDHIYQKVVGHSQSTVDWFIEGDATYFEISQDYDYLNRVKEMAAAGDLPTIQGEGPSIRGENARDGYDIGYAFFKWLEATYGPDAHRQLWQLLAKGKSRTEALKQVTGKDFVDMEVDFRTWLGASNPQPPTLMPTEAFQFPPTPTYDTSFLPATSDAGTPTPTP